ncbi:SymE family type I addiction module toxin [Pantoea allii]|uniref:SymE family type I addiction module toxin n=1 Tax=Pantoea allii TaxID=574096 RepID=UPI0024B86459|nr:SymE family type I addiction module toxin [Pantoea allii]MDJ0038530.1 SymE family type I addiction module toxin [Pantoea allii]
MAAQDTKPEVSISKALRRLKVGYTSIRHADRNDITTYYSRCPSLNLKGSWLAEAGFRTGQSVQVMVERGQLIIQLAEG